MFCVTLLLTCYSLSVAQNFVQQANIKLWKANDGNCVSKDNQKLLRSKVEKIFSTTAFFHNSMEFTESYQLSHVRTFMMDTHLVTTG